MLTTKKLGQGYYRLEWNKRDIVGKWVENKGDKWVLVNSDNEIEYQANTKKEVINHASQWVDIEE